MTDDDWIVTTRPLPHDTMRGTITWTEETEYEIVDERDLTPPARQQQW